MDEVTGLWFALFVMVAFPICCGIFCLWFDYNESWVQRICEKNYREYMEKERAERHE